MSVQDAEPHSGRSAGSLTLVRVPASDPAGTATAAHSLYGRADLPMAPTDFDLMSPRSLGLCTIEAEGAGFALVLCWVSFRLKPLTLKGLAALVFDLARTTAALELDIGS